MQALQYDVGTYLTYGDSEYSVVWAGADLTYELFKSGKMKSTMPAQAYQNIVNNLNAVYSRLGIIYTNREYAIEFFRKYQPQAQSQPEQEPQSQLQFQQAPINTCRFLMESVDCNWNSKVISLTP
ncbi:hypothetical protein REC12_11715 [Desulfosporosinus sp. PR]|uniref:hypothetical protein n=1 Tax=Candidatus Desulfosporosinus nitrosoreducens TaxID=3401928 RepID=UPI0027F50A3D|nr:hypothetical protein [Desulfosporosinus sp. PR]MDQ7094257.1 hypothetical protein [Desulfosporosinus sp. PR]